MFTFLKEYIKDPDIVGAVMPSGKALARRMIEPINFEEAKCIVEYGPGLGAFTKEIVKRKKEDTELILIEQNKVFFKKLKQMFRKEKGVSIFCGSAECINEYLREKGILEVDYIVSGLPFKSIPLNISKRIFFATQKAIGRKGTFITFQYTLIRKELFEEYFVISRCYLEKRNLPSAYVFEMKNRNISDNQKFDNDASL